MNEELRRFIRRSLEQGIDRESIRNALLEAGWQEREVRSALASFADLDFPLAVPRPRPYLHAREAFLYLVSFIALYVFAFSLGTVLFGLIDHAFSDALVRYVAPRSTGAATAIAAVIVAFPLYLALMRRLGSAVAADPERRQSLVRRWLTYVTLVVGAGVILGDVIVLLAGLLTGDPTLNFILKVAAVLLIVAPIFGYYLWDMRQAEGEASVPAARAAPVLRGLVILAVVVVVAIVGYSIYVVGTPGQQRNVRLDEQRVDDLRNISGNIDRYHEINGEMPATLSDLVDPRYHVRSTVDPQTGAMYEYRTLDGAGYELCAVFSAESPGRGDERRPFWESAWDHGAGRTCFELRVEGDGGGGS